MEAVATAIICSVMAIGFIVYFSIKNKREKNKIADSNC